jgi:transposase-like protein
MKIPKQAYTIEFKELAVKRIKDGQSVSKVCKELGLSARPFATGSRRRRRASSAVLVARW